jgi:hypothetical protein
MTTKCLFPVHDRLCSSSHDFGNCREDPSVVMSLFFFDVVLVVVVVVCDFEICARVQKWGRRTDD